MDASIVNEKNGMNVFILEIDGISKAFGGLKAIDDISFGVAVNTVHGIIGPNGAGKTTLFNVITGMTAPTSGEVRIEGKPIPPIIYSQSLPHLARGPESANKRGRGMILPFQRPHLRGQ